MKPLLAGLLAAACAFRVAADLSVSPDPVRAIPLRSGIFSIAADTTLGGYGPANPAPLSILREIRPTFLRVPGGDSMNLWDSNAGLPLTREQVLAAGESLDNPKVVTALRNRARYAEVMGGPMTADRWVALAGQGGSVPIWGLDVTSLDAAATGAFVATLKAKGLSATRFELGNELYLGKVWKRQAPNVGVYLRKAQAHAAAVKAVFPGAKVAVCITAPLAPMAAGEAPPPAAQSWDEPIARQTWYDAVVLHAYAMSGDLGDLKDVTADAYARWAMVRSSGVFLGRVYNWLGRTFPGREIWMTEWNLNSNIYDRAHPDERSRYRPAHTMLSGLFVASVLLNSAARPSNLALANYWQICGEPEFGLISGQPPRRQPAFQVFRLLSPAVRACDLIEPLEVAGAPRVRGPGRFDGIEVPEIQGFAFYSGGALRYLAFVNFTGNDAAVRVPGGARYAVQTLAGPELLPGWGRENPGGLEAWAPVYTVTSSRAEAGSIAVAARSFTLAEVEGYMQP